jgi:glycosyltransferase involved in cell wall biosynthesis
MHLEPVVQLLGQVSDETLRSYLSHADVCVNLRYPAFEGASASVIEEMLFGKPVIVTDTGFFAELPDECVLKVRPDRGSELTAALERAITDPGFRERLGKAAEQFARREFRADHYAKEIVDFAWEARTAKPLLGLADQVAIEFNRMGIASDMAIVDNLAQEMRSTFCSMPGSGPSWR